jgi:hypothetical protein
VSISWTTKELSLLDWIEPRVEELRQLKKLIKLFTCHKVFPFDRAKDFRKVFVFKKNRNP